MASNSRLYSKGRGKGDMQQGLVQAGASPGQSRLEWATAQTCALKLNSPTAQAQRPHEARGTRHRHEACGISHEARGTRHKTQGTKHKP